MVKTKVNVLFWSENRVLQGISSNGEGKNYYYFTIYENQGLN